MNIIIFILRNFVWVVRNYIILVFRPFKLLNFRKEFMANGLQKSLTKFDQSKRHWSRHLQIFEIFIFERGPVSLVVGGPLDDLVRAVKVTGGSVRALLIVAKFVIAVHCQIIVAVVGPCSKETHSVSTNTFTSIISACDQYISHWSRKSFSPRTIKVIQVYTSLMHPDVYFPF